MAQNVQPDSAPAAQLTTATIFAHAAKQDAMSDAFKLHHAKFGQLGSQEDFQHFQSQLIEIDISKALNHLGDEHYLEVTLPTTGLTDFLSQDAPWQAMGQQFATILAINGYGGGSGEGVYPKPHHILAEDIIGNQYELLVEPDGSIQGPEEGIGLFSLIKSFTFMYSKEQILNGEHLSNLSDVGAKAGYIYLLAPIGVETEYHPTIKVSHLDDYLNPQIDFEMNVPILLQSVESPMDNHIDLHAEKLDTDLGQFLHLELSSKNFGSTLNKPFDVTIDIGQVAEVSFTTPEASLSNQLQHNLGWVQNLDNPSEFTKAYGLSEFGLTALARNLYSEFDFTKSLLQGESLGLSQENHYNDFMLSKEAIGVTYDLMLNDVVQQKMPFDAILSQVPDERIADLDLSYAEFDAHDAQVIDTLTEQVSQFQFDGLKSLFASHHDDSSPSQDFFDDMFVQIQGELSELPHIDVMMNAPHEFTDAALIIDNPLEFSLPDTAAPLADSFTTNGYEALLSEQAPDVDYGSLSFNDVIDAGSLTSEIGSSIEGVELNALLANLPSAQDGVTMAEYQGHDLHMTMEASGESDVSSHVMTPVNPLGDDFSGNFTPDL